MLSIGVLSTGVTLAYMTIQWMFGSLPAPETMPYEIVSATQSAGLNSLIGIATLVGMMFSVGVTGHFLDRRPLGDFGFHFNLGWLLDLGFGLALGAVLMMGIFAIEWAAGWITPAVGVKPDIIFAIDILAQLVLFLCVGIYEELLTRSYLLINLAEGLNFRFVGPRVALVTAWILTSLLFGLGHAGNPNASIISNLSIALAGIFLGLGYVLTGELSIPIGLHITWNLFQGTVFGFPVSGSGFGVSFITLQQGGPSAWTGGDFGPEAGLIGIAAMVIGSIMTLVWIKLRHKRITLQHDLAQYTPRSGSAAPLT